MAWTFDDSVRVAIGMAVVLVALLLMVAGSAIGEQQAGLKAAYLAEHMGHPDVAAAIKGLP